MVILERSTSCRTPLKRLLSRCAQVDKFASVVGARVPCLCGCQRGWVAVACVIGTRSSSAHGARLISSSGCLVSQATSNLVWRFSVPNERWERYQITQTASAGLWPAPRAAACTTNAWLMFGGVVRDRLGAGLPHADGECLGPSTDESGRDVNQGTNHPGYREATMLSGLWRWQDNVGSTFYQ